MIGETPAPSPSEIAGTEKPNLYVDPAVESSARATAENAGTSGGNNGKASEAAKEPALKIPENLDLQQLKDAEIQLLAKHQQMVEKGDTRAAEAINQQRIQLARGRLNPNAPSTREAYARAMGLYDNPAEHGVGSRTGSLEDSFISQETIGVRDPALDSIKVREAMPSMKTPQQEVTDLAAEIQRRERALAGATNGPGMAPGEQRYSIQKAELEALKQKLDEAQSKLTTPEPATATDEAQVYPFGPGVGGVGIGEGQLVNHDNVEAPPAPAAAPAETKAADTDADKDKALMEETGLIPEELARLREKGGQTDEDIRRIFGKREPGAPTGIPDIERGMGVSIAEVRERRAAETPPSPEPPPPQDGPPVGLEPGSSNPPSPEVGPVAPGEVTELLKTPDEILESERDKLEKDLTMARDRLINAKKVSRSIFGKIMFNVKARMHNFHRAADTDPIRLIAEQELAAAQEEYQKAEAAFLTMKAKQRIREAVGRGVIKDKLIDVEKKAAANELIDRVKANQTDLHEAFGDGGVTIGNTVKRRELINSGKFTEQELSLIQNKGLLPLVAEVPLVVRPVTGPEFTAMQTKLDALTPEQKAAFAAKFPEGLKVPPGGFVGTEHEKSYAEVAHYLEELEKPDTRKPEAERVAAEIALELQKAKNLAEVQGILTEVKLQEMQKFAEEEFRKNAKEGLARVLSEWAGNPYVRTALSVGLLAAGGAALSLGPAGLPIAAAALAGKAALAYTGTERMMTGIEQARGWFSAQEGKTNLENLSQIHEFNVVRGIRAATAEQQAFQQKLAAEFGAAVAKGLDVKNPDAMATALLDSLKVENLNMEQTDQAKMARLKKIRVVNKVVAASVAGAVVGLGAAQIMEAARGAGSAAEVTQARPTLAAPGPVSPEATSSVVNTPPVETPAPSSYPDIEKVRAVTGTPQSVEAVLPGPEAPTGSLDKIVINQGENPWMKLQQMYPDLNPDQIKQLDQILVQDNKIGVPNWGVAGSPDHLAIPPGTELQLSDRFKEALNAIRAGK